MDHRPRVIKPHGLWAPSPSLPFHLFPPQHGHFSLLGPQVWAHMTSPPWASYKACYQQQQHLSLTEMTSFIGQGQVHKLRIQFESQLCHPSAANPYTNSLTSLCLSFFTCKKTQS